MLTPAGHVDPAFTVAYRDFHHTLLAGCCSSRLADIATGLRDCAEFYQYWSQAFARDITRDIATEHTTVAELTVARDDPCATQALRDHIERTIAALVRYAEQLDAKDDERALA